MTTAIHRLRRPSNFAGDPVQNGIRQMHEVLKKLRFNEGGVVLNVPAELNTTFAKPGFRNALDPKNLFA